MISDTTKFSDLQSIGADSVGDVSLIEWMYYIRNTCLNLAKDKQACEELGLEDASLEVIMSLEKAIKSIEFFYLPK